MKNKTNKQTPRKPKTKQSKTKNQKPKSKKIIVYSKNPKTGYETVIEAKKMEKDGMKSVMVKSESVLPPIVITHKGTDYTSTETLSMSQKRQMVVQSFRA